MLLSMFTFRIFVLEILYSRLFISASDLLLFQLLGDLCRVFASLFSLWMFSRMKIKELIFIDTIFNLFVFLSPNILHFCYPGNLIIIPISYFIASLIQFSLFYMYTIRALKFSFTSKVKRIIDSSFIVLILGIGISLSNLTIGYAANIILLITWGIVYLNILKGKN